MSSRCPCWALRAFANSAARGCDDGGITQSCGQGFNRGFQGARPAHDIEHLRSEDTDRLVLGKLEEGVSFAFHVLRLQVRGIMHCDVAIAFG